MNAVEALERIVEWEERERPHRNIPLADCAKLARLTLQGEQERHDHPLDGAADCAECSP